MYTFMGWELFLSNIFVVAFCSSVVWQCSLLHHIKKLIMQSLKKPQQSFNNNGLKTHHCIKHIRQLMVHNYEIINLNMFHFVVPYVPLCCNISSKYQIILSVSTHQHDQSWLLPIIFLVNTRVYMILYSSNITC